MAAGRSAGASRPPVLLILLLFAAVAIGVSATYLSSPSDPFHETPNPSSGLGPSGAVIAEAVFFLFVAIILFLAVYRVVAGGQRGQGRAILSILYVFLVSIIFLIAAHYALTSGSSPEVVGNQTGGGSGGTPVPPPIGGNSSNGSLHPPGPLPIAPSVPGWVAYAILVGVAVLLTVYLAPYLLARGRLEGAEASAASGVERSLEQALRALEPGAEADARATVIALYARLLQELGPYLEHLETATPREIERESVSRFGLQPENARALTRLFEEARYSSHPFTDSQVVAARAALATALTDLKGVRARP